MAKLAKPKANNGKSKQKANSKDSDDQNSISDYEESEKSEEDEDIDDDDDDEDEEKEENGDGDKKETKNATTKKESSFASDCKKLFGKTNLYEILGVEKDCQLIEIKKAYHKLSLKVHPDKVKDEHKEEAKSKFQTLGKVYTVLSDAEKRKTYDETGAIDDHDFVSGTTDWNSYYRALFKRISEEDIGGFFKNYRDSPEEKEDLLKVYKKYKGNMDLILEDMFCESMIEDEERFSKIIKDAIEKKEIEAYDDFTNETDKKKKNRKNKYEKEAKEAEEMKKELGLDGDLKKAIAQSNESRKKAAETLFKNLEEKYSKPARGKPQAKRAKKDESEDEEEEVEHFSDDDESFEGEEEEDDDEDYGKSKRKSKTAAKKPSPVKRKATPKRGKKHDDDDDEEETKPKKQSARNKKRVSYKDGDSEEEEDDDDDDDDSFDMEDDDDEDYGKSKKKKSPVKGKPMQSKNTRAKKVKRL